MLGRLPFLTYLRNVLFVAETKAKLVVIFVPPSVVMALLFFVIDMSWFVWASLVVVPVVVPAVVLNGLTLNVLSGLP